MSEVDPAATPPMHPVRRYAIAILSLVLAVFVLSTSATGAFESILQRAIFVALIVPLGLLLMPLNLGPRLGWLALIIDGAAALCVVAASVRVGLRFEEIMTDFPIASPFDVALTLGAIAVFVELSRRSASLIFSCLVLIIVGYALFGDVIPASFGHSGFSLDYLSEVLFLSDRGFWGMLTGIGATTLASFVLFGAILLHTGAGRAFMDIASRLSGSSVGGAAKMATVASGLFGTISGSAVANVATTGNFTIPLMKRLRYPSSFAGGVEASASTGGQLAPPIMGASAFVMADVTGINYWTIAAAGVLPALLYYSGLFLTIHLFARQNDLGRMTADQLPTWAEALDWRRLTPIIAAIAGLAFGVANGNSIERTAFLGSVAMLLAYFVVCIVTRVPIAEVRGKILETAKDAGNGLCIVGVLLVCAQIFVSIINLSGAGVALTAPLANAAGAGIWLVLLVSAVVCLIAGMGLPTTAAYVLVAAVFAPAVLRTGLDTLTVHFFIFYYATLSVITPPVGIGVFVAAIIAREKWTKVAKEAMRLAGIAYVLPVLFVLYPGMLNQGDWMETAQAVLSGGCFVVAMAFVLSGAGGRTAYVRCLYLAPAGLALVTGWVATLAAVVLLAVLLTLRGFSQGPLRPALKQGEATGSGPAAPLFLPSNPEDAVVDADRGTSGQPPVQRRINLTMKGDHHAKHNREW